MNSKCCILMMAGLACGLTTITATQAAAQAKASNGPQYGAWGVDLSQMDRAIKPGDDFHMYVNGRWERNTNILADQTDTGPLVDLQNLALEQSRKIHEESAADTKGREAATARSSVTGTRR